MAEVRAVCYDTDGYVMTEEEIKEWHDDWNNGATSLDREPDVIAVVTGTAMPVLHYKGDTAERVPGSHLTLDLICEWDDVHSLDADDVWYRWSKAKQIAESLTS